MKMETEYVGMAASRATLEVPGPSEGSPGRAQGPKHAAQPLNYSSTSFDYAGN